MRKEKEKSERKVQRLAIGTSKEKEENEMWGTKGGKGGEVHLLSSFLFDLKRGGRGKKKETSANLKKGRGKPATR